MTEIRKQTIIITKTRTHVRPPSLFNVVMFNDDYTTMEFVVMVLMDVFDYDKDTAIQRMLEIHHSVKRVVGTYVKSVAEYKVQQCNELKIQYGYPWFRVEIEKVEPQND